MESILARPTGLHLHSSSEDQGLSFYLNGVAGQSDAGDLLKVLRRGGASPATHGTAATPDEAKA